MNTDNELLIATIQAYGRARKEHDNHPREPVAPKKPTVITHLDQLAIWEAEVKEYKSLYALWKSSFGAVKQQLETAKDALIAATPMNYITFAMAGYSYRTVELDSGKRAIYDWREVK